MKEMNRRRGFPFSLFARFLFLVILGVITVRVLSGNDFFILQNANLIFHEAGHVFFIFFGTFFSFLGGTLGQLLVPIIVLVSFLRRADFFGATFALWWIGENLADISVYIGDARAQQIPLLGGEHDWAYILGELDLLRYDAAIAKMIWTLGVFMMIAALFLGFLFLWRKYTETQRKHVSFSG